MLSARAKPRPPFAEWAERRIPTAPRRRTVSRILRRLFLVPEQFRTSEKNSAKLTITTITVVRSSYFIASEFVLHLFRTVGLRMNIGSLSLKIADDGS
jgi:hypothetical protein